VEIALVTAPIDRHWQESIARVYARAAELIVAHDDWPLDGCVQLAMMEEVFLHGIPNGSETPPIGITGGSPLRMSRER
jgi:hypothetical protein